MKIKKSEIDESKKLFDSMEAAKKIDLSEKIQAIEEKILELHTLYEKERILRHHGLMQLYSNEKSILFSKIEALRSGKHQEIEHRIFDFDKFHRSFKGRFSERLVFLYGKIEQEFAFSVEDSTELMFARRHKIKTNALSVLECLKNISLEIVFFRESRAVLSVLNARLEDFEKALDVNFPEKVFSVIGDDVLLQLRDLMPSVIEYDNPEFKPLIYSPDVIGHKIALISGILKV